MNDRAMTLALILQTRTEAKDARGYVAEAYPREAGFPVYGQTVRGIGATRKDARANLLAALTNRINTVGLEVTG